MKSNVTGGIILFIVGALIIAIGVSEKGKRVFNILTDGEGSLLGGGTSSGTGEDIPEGETFSGHPGDPDWIDPNGGNLFGFGGEKGAVALG